MTARITVDGNLVADPDFGVGDSGTSWAHLRVASHERIRRDGEWISTDPEFYNVTLFGARRRDRRQRPAQGRPGHRPGPTPTGNVRPPRRHPRQRKSRCTPAPWRRPNPPTPEPTHG